MKPINSKILSEYLVCPYKLKFSEDISLNFSQNQNLKSVSNKSKYAELSKNIKKSITEFFYLPASNRTIKVLENILRLNWNSGIFINREEERNYGLEAIGLLNNFYFNNDVYKSYTYIGKFFKNKVLNYEFPLEIILGEINKAQKTFLLFEFSISKYIGKKIDLLYIKKNFTLLNKICYIFSVLDVNELILCKKNIRYNSNEQIKISRDEYYKLKNYIEQKIKEYLSAEEYIRELGSHCNFCNSGILCQLSAKTNYTQNTKFFELINFLGELLNIDINIIEFEKVLIKYSDKFLPGERAKNIIEIEKIKNMFNEEVENYIKLYSKSFYIDYLEYNESYIYFFKFDRLNSDKVFIFDSLYPYEYEQILTYNFILEFIKVKLEQIYYYEQSVKDKMTDLYNHGYYRNVSEKELLRCKEFSYNLGIILFDIDFFKKFNDTYGHQIGDFIIKSIAKVFKNNIRLSDIPIRYGGEEFICICSNIKDNKELYGIAEQIRTEIEKTDFVDTNGKKYKVTISGGISLYPQDSNTILELVRVADERLYKAKQNGRNRIEYEK